MLALALGFYLLFIFGALLEHFPTQLLRTGAENSGRDSRPRADQAKHGQAGSGLVMALTGLVGFFRSKIKVVIPESAWEMPVWEDGID